MSITWKRGAPVAVAVAALLSISAAPALAGQPKHSTQSAQIEGDTTGGVVDSQWGDDDTKEGKQAARGPGAWDASKDLGSMYSLTKSIGAQDAWLRGATGNNVTVALI